MSESGISATFIEPERRLPVTARVHVLVCGGGSAGFAAAVASARSGASTLLLEATGVLGRSRHRSARF